MLRILQDNGEMKVSKLDELLKAAGFNTKTCSTAKTELANSGEIERIRAKNEWTVRLSETKENAEESVDPTEYPNTEDNPENRGVNDGN